MILRPGGARRLNLTSTAILMLPFGSAKSGRSEAQVRRRGLLRYNQGLMSSTSQVVTRTPAEVVRMARVTQAVNGICYSAMGEATAGASDLERMVNAVP